MSVFMNVCQVQYTYIKQTKVLLKAKINNKRKSDLKTSKQNLFH